MPHPHLFTLLCGMLLSDAAFGYINPDSGYILWQILFGAVVGSVFYMRKFLGVVFRWVKRIKNNS